jgi:N-acylneuraminate cytidylyltransferase
VNICLIPARGGSKSIPLKNIINVGGKPLIWWVLNSAQKSNLDKIYVSTDSKEIKEVVESFNFSKVEVINRSKEVSSDTATTESVMVEFAEQYEFDTLTLLQVTSPLTNVDHINESLETLIDGKWDSIVSIVREFAFQWYINENGKFKPRYDINNRPRRQDYGGRLTENGAIYITTSESFRRSKCRVSGNITFYEMPNHTLYEIDEPNDVIIIEKLLEEYG